MKPRTRGRSFSMNMDNTPFMCGQTCFSHPTAMLIFLSPINIGILSQTSPMTAILILLSPILKMPHKCNFGSIMPPLNCLYWVVKIPTRQI